ncbi:MAG TPA: ABC transporter permease [Phenylobacterium sp.]|uniref:ABC transporter permease n=1 Tax=Phenylobacterium sp. TaxID=1871053 RepID=UPI002C27D48E|nr:ABC transporter permease [Phenylobacterium sp.]HSV02597.1 ABC transporter permease [Phenylobacterium sp.]
MTPMLLVARREFRQIARTRSFWVTLLLFPVAIVLSQVSVRFFRPAEGAAYVIVDDTGRYAPAIDRRLKVNAERQTLSALATYAERWKIAPDQGQQVWAGGPRWFSDADVAAFEAAGGLPVAQAQIARRKPAAAPDFRAPKPAYVRIAPPAGVVTTAGPERFGASLAPLLKTDVATSQGPRPLGLAVYIPADFGAAPARLWTNGRAYPQLIEDVRQELNQGLRLRALQAEGIDLAALARAQTVSAPITLTVPPTGSGRERMILRSALPLGFAYLLLISLMVSGAWMLQGLIEERSNKLLEAVIACITPEDLLYGKLIGVLAIGAVMILAWIGFAVAAGFVFQGAIADYLRPALASVSSPWVVVALVYFFAAGYLCISMLFLAIGSMSDNMRDAQGYLSPMILALTLPVAAMMSAVLQNPDGPLPRTLSWIPVYAPFAMMARLGSGVSPLEVAGSAAVLAVFIGLELVVIGRLFRANLLQAGQPLRLKDLPRLLARAPA